MSSCSPARNDPNHGEQNYSDKIYARIQVIALFFGKREPSSHGNARLIQLTHELRTVRVQVWDVESDARVQRCQVRDYAGLREQG